MKIATGYSCLVIIVAAGLLSAGAGAVEFSADAGLVRARSAALAPQTERGTASAVVWRQGAVSSPEAVFAVDGHCAVLKRTAGDAEAPAFALDFGKSSVEGWALVHVRSARGNPVLKLAYANYPEKEALREDGDFNEASRGRYMGRDTDLPILPANVNRHELYRITRSGTFLAPMLMPQFRYMRVQLDSPGEVEIDAIEILQKDVCDTSLLDGYFESSDPKVNRLWQIGVWTAQLGTVKTTWAWNVVEGRLQPRRLARGGDLHFSVADDVLPKEGSLSVKLECGINPALLAHAGLALFGKDEENALLFSISEAGTLTWTRRNAGVDTVLHESRFEAPLADCREHDLRISWRKPDAEILLSVSLDGKDIGSFAYYHPPHGRRLGFWCPKGWWPTYDDLTVADGEGKTVFADDFEDATLAKWSFERPDPFVSDGAKRDRFVWSGDLYWAGRNFYYAFADNALMLKTIELLARNQNPQGYVLACPYAEQPSPKDGELGPFESDEFAAWFIPVLHDYWRHTGDEAAARRFYPNVRKLLGYLGQFKGPEGIFEQRFETSKHAFAPRLQKGDVRHRSYMDILLWMCWRGGAEMARALGETSDAERWEDEARQLRAAVNRVYWDEAHGFFRESKEGHSVLWQGVEGGDRYAGKMVKGPDTPADYVAMEPNSMAVESGLATPEQARRICPQLAAQSWVRKFILLSSIAKARTGDGEDAWRTISTNNWGLLVKDDWNGPWATPEGLDMLRYGAGDQSHPDVAPAGFISSCYLGVVPRAAGFAKFEFSPKPTLGMSYAEGRVPTKFGPIDARWERTSDGFAFDLTVPRGTTADVVPPCGAVVEVDGKTGDGTGLTPGRHRLVSRNGK